MKQGIQTMLSEAGEAACYALDIIEIAERASGKKLDPIEALWKGIDRGFIYYNETNPDDNDNFYVRDPGAFLSMMTSARWNVRKEGPGYKGAPESKPQNALSKDRKPIHTPATIIEASEAPFAPTPFDPAASLMLSSGIPALKQSSRI
jgi:hypothetical protein